MSKPLLTLLAIGTLALLSGCTVSMSAKQQVDDCNYCVDHGYTCDIVRDGLGGHNVINVNCLPPSQ